MATALTSAEILPDGDYTTSHRSPPPIPTIAYDTTQASTSPQFLHEPGRPGGGASEAGSIKSSYSERRRGSLGSFLRRTSSHTSTLRQQQEQNDVPAVPALPATRIGQVHQAAAVASQNGGRASTSSNRKTSTEGGRTMLRKSSKMKAAAAAEREEQERLARQRAPPPRLPSHHPLPGIDSFGGDEARQYNNTNFSRPGNSMPSSSYANSSSSPAYAVRGGQVPSSPPAGRTNGEYVDSDSVVERNESMTHRGRYSYASSIVPVNTSSPRRIRRRKDPTPFNVLVVGAKNSGKTSFISFLRHSLSRKSSNHDSNAEPQNSAQRSAFSSHYLETEMDGERVGLTLYDSAGLEKNLVDLQMREMVAFVESKFEETFVEEQKVMRSPGAKDTHIHCVFLVLDPIRLDATVAASSATQTGNINLANVSGLDDDLDLQVIRALWGKTTVIPVVSKADTLTVGHMAFLKRAVWQSIKGAKMDPLEALELEDDIEEEDEDEEDYYSQDDSSDVIDSYTDNSAKAKKSHKRQSSLSVRSSGGDEDTPYIPMAILSPDPYDLPPHVPKAKAEKVGRRFPWGLADPYNPDHCDFTRLRDSIFSEWKGELRDLSRSKWYENWRTSRLKNLPGSKQRMKGGVTPVAAVPGGGRSASAGYNGAGAVPRSVSGNQSTAGANSMDARPSKAERIMGMPAGGANGAHY